jgi:hypothetical protein
MQNSGVAKKFLDTAHKARGGNWPPTNDELVVNYLNAFPKFVKSIDFQKLN